MKSRFLNKIFLIFVQVVLLAHFSFIDLMFSIKAVSAAAVLYIATTEQTNKTKINPGDNLSYNIFVLNDWDSSDNLVNPKIGAIFNSSNITYISGTWTTDQLPSLPGGAGFNPPTSSTGAFAGNLFPGSTAMLNFTINVTTGFTARTIILTGNGYGDNAGIVSSSKTIKVNSIPHIKSVTFSKATIINNGVDSADLIVKVMDRNGCSNMIGGSSYVRADLSSLGYSTIENLTYDSCEADNVTAVYKFANIMTSVSAGSKNVNTRSADAQGNVANSDTDFSSDDGSVIGTISVNTPTAPIVTINSISNTLIGLTTNANINWQSNYTGTYLIYGGSSASCAGGNLIATGTYLTANAANVNNFTYTNLNEGNNNIFVCLTNAQLAQGSSFTGVVRDTTAPTVTVSQYSTNVATGDVKIVFSANQTGTYQYMINGLPTGPTGSYTGGTISVSAANALFPNGTGNIAMRVVDPAGNTGTSSTYQMYKDNVPLNPPTNVALQDCDYAGNVDTYCEQFGNPLNGINGRDFYVTWQTPILGAGFEAYYVYILPQSMTFNADTQGPLAIITGSSVTGTIINSLITTDSAGQPLLSGNYVAYVSTRKNNGLNSTPGSSTGAAIVFDNILKPSFVSAKFVSTTGLQLIYNTNLTGTLNRFNASRISSSSSCFVMDTSSGTGALSVSGVNVIFKINAINNLSKTCSDLSILTGAVRSDLNVFNEDIVTGGAITDGQAPFPITITNPMIGAVISGSGVFSMVYSFPENMLSGSIFMNFENQLSQILAYNYGVNNGASTYTKSLTGSTLGLVDGTLYSLYITGTDLAGNYGTSNIITGVLYDLSAPTVPVSQTLADGSYINTSTPTFTWTASTDNYSTGNNIKYNLQISTVNTFASMTQNLTGITGTSYTLATSLSTNTTYYWRIRAYDQASNYSNFDTIRSFVFDNNAPVISTNPVNTYIQNTTLGLTGYARNGNILVLNAVITDNLSALFGANNITANMIGLGGSNSTPASYNTGSGQATWSNVTTNCTDGTIQVPISAMDVSNNSATTVNVSVICDNTAPSVGSAWTFPTAGAYLKGGTGVTLTWNPSLVTDANFVTNPITLEYSSNGGSAWTQIATNLANNGSYNWTTPGINSNSFVLRLTALDKVGLTGSVQVALNMDNTPPTVANNTIISPNGNQIFNGGAGTIIPITWNTSASYISDAVGIGVNPITLYYSTNGGVSWTQIAAGLPNNGSYNWTVPSNINSTLMRIRLQVDDLAGWIASDTSDANFILDATDPTLTVNQLPPTGSRINNSGIQFNISAGDTYLSGLYYSFTNGGNYWNGSSYVGSLAYNLVCADSLVLGNGGNCNTFGTTITPTIVDGSNYTLAFRALDEAGRQTLSTSYNYVGDLIAPVLSINNASGSYFADTLSLSGSASDTGSSVTSVDVQILKGSQYWDGAQWTGGTYWISLTGSLANWSYGFTPPLADNADQNYTVNVQSKDNAYTVKNTSTQNILINRDKVGPNVPASIFTFASGITYRGGQVLNITWNNGSLSDTGAGLGANPITLKYWDGIQYLNITGAVNIPNSGSYAWNLPTMDASTQLTMTVADNLGNTNVTVSSGFAIDSLPPTISSVETLDQDTNGQIDGVLVKMSENVLYTGVVIGDWSSNMGITITGKTTTPNNNEFILTFANTGDTSTVPTLTYTAGSLTDMVGNPLANVSKLTIDTAAPRILSGAVYDNNSDAKIDTIKLFFSENMASTNNTSAIVINNPMVGLSLASVAISSNQATLNLNQSTNYDTSTGGMYISFTSNTNWKDLAITPNQSASNANIILSDLAVPKVFTAITNDNNSNYKANRVLVSFSEDLTGFNISEFTLSGLRTGSVLTGGSFGTDQLILNITETTNDNDTDLTGSLNYSGSNLQDLAGNNVSIFTGLSVTDGIVPKLMSVYTQDTDGNGHINRLKYTFSESLNHTYSSYITDITGYSVIGYTGSQAITYVNFTEKLNYDTDAQPLTKISSNTSLTDLAGNYVPTQTSSVNASDGAGPVVISARYESGSPSPDNDILNVNFSEAVSGATIDTSVGGVSNDFVVYNGGAFAGASQAGNIQTSSVELTMGAGATALIPGTTQVSIVSGAIADAYGNLAPAPNVSNRITLAAPIIINEIMWGGTSAAADDDYVEILNLGNNSIDFSTSPITICYRNGSSYTAAKTINSGTLAASGYALISRYAESSPSSVLNIAPDQTGLLDLPATNFEVAIFDGVGCAGDLADKVGNRTTPYSGSNNISMERVSGCLDGLNPACFYQAQVSSGFDNSTTKGTPKLNNVRDATAPVITYFSPDNSTGDVLFGAGNIPVRFDYNDGEGLGISTGNVTLVLSKWDGSSWINISSTGYTTLGVTQQRAQYVTNNLGYGKYKIDFSVPDVVNNTQTKSIIFFVDGFSFTISNANILYGGIGAGINYDTGSTILTVKTVGAGYDVNMDLSNPWSGPNSIIDWNGTNGFGVAVGAGSFTGVSALTVTNQSKSIDTNGNRNTYTYLINYRVNPTTINPSGSYTKQLINSVNINY